MIEMLLREFTDSPDYDDYFDFRFDVMKTIWGARTQPYLTGSDVPFIGTGFNMRASLDNFKTIAEEILGADYNVELAVDLWNIVKDYSGGTDEGLRRKLNNFLADQEIAQTFSFENLAEIKSALATLGADAEFYIEDYGDVGMAYSKERAVVFSIAFEGADVSAILENIIWYRDRDTAWFDIRYQTNDGGKKDVAARRYVQSDLFQLYNNPNGVGYPEAYQVIREYQSRRNEAMAYEHKFDPGKAADDIYDNLQPAIRAVAKYFGLTLGHVDEALFTSRSKPVLNGDGTQYDSAKNDNDLLIGDAENNTISGGQGDDVILALGGKDWLSGGNGNDTLYGGNGDDELQGGQGHDRMVGGGGKDRLVGGSGNDTYLLMTDAPSNEPEPDPFPSPSLVGANNSDVIVEAKDGGNDTVLVGVSGTFDIRNVENFRLSGDIGRNISAKLNEFDGFRLSKGDDTLTLTINRLQKDAIDIWTGGGADTIRIKLAPGIDPSQVLDHKGVTARFDMRDLTAQDTIDLSSIGIRKIVTNDLDISRDKGFYLMAPDAQIHLMDGNEEVKTYTNDTDSWFVVRCGDDTPYGPEFIGNVSKDNFEI